MQAPGAITIVGGGTAGWLAACYLQRTLADLYGTRIRLIESREIGIIGVGEATVPSLRNTLATIGLPEDALFREADATLKNGIRFVGWRQGGDAATDRFDHPFDFPPALVEAQQVYQRWLNAWHSGATTVPMGDACNLQTALFDHLRSPKLLDSADYAAPMAYAYHLDAVRLAQLLCRTATGRGVEHVIGDVVEGQRGPDGIASLLLADGSRHTADLFVDCTGFRALLIGKTLGVPWNSFAEWLPCDRAVACPVAYDSPTSPIRSYTTATAQGAGWIWDIGLQSRRGTGYVYASTHCSDDEAVATLRRYHGNDRALAEPRLLRMRIGHQARAWEGNCLAIGLAGGFIEPLESTGIYLVEHVLERFVAQLGVPRDAAQRRLEFNRHVADTYGHLRDFIVAHYALSRRRDTDFWRAVTDPATLAPGLADLLATWRSRIPEEADLEGRRSLFGRNSWFCILAGQHHVPPQAPTSHSAAPPPDPRSPVLAQVQAARHAAVKAHPDLRAFVGQRGPGKISPSPSAQTSS
jgi:tryptophan halogenase